MIFLAAFANFVSGQRLCAHLFQEGPKFYLEVATGVPEGTESGALPKRPIADEGFSEVKSGVSVSRNVARTRAFEGSLADG
jgi:hypothetical protein